MKIRNLSKTVGAFVGLGLMTLAVSSAQANPGEWIHTGIFAFQIISENPQTQTGGLRLMEVAGDASEVIIPETLYSGETGYTYTVDEIGSRVVAFHEVSITRFFIPKTVNFIAELPFGHMVDIKSLEVDEASPYFSSPDGVLMDKEQTTIIYYPQTRAIPSYTIPSTVKILESYSFAFNETLEELYMPDSVTEIRFSAFGSAVALKKIRLSAGVKSLPEQLFWHCISLQEVIIPEGVEEIGAGFFGLCETLTKVEFPASIKHLGSEMFPDCMELKGVYFNGNAPETDGDIFGYWGEEDIIVYYRKGTTGWGPTFCDRPTAVWGDEPQPTADISCEYKDGLLILTFTGNLQESTDTKTWKTLDAASPYTVKPDGTQKFYRTMTGGSENQNFTIPLSNTVNLDMIWIEPGTFLMGSPEGELGRNNEIQHEVTLTKEYWIGKYEVTQAQYETIMASNPSMFKGDDMPVDNISWDHAMSFCKALTEIEKTAGRLPEGYEYTLPTEAQWEYACRAGTTTALNSGKNLSSVGACPEMDEVGWYAGNSEGVFQSVGQKKANAWGLYDMHGNVQEWCLDWYEENYPTSAVTDPQGPNSGSERIYRGGDWSQWAYSCRSANRGHAAQNHSVNGYVGFRVALAPVK